MAKEMLVQSSACSLESKWKINVSIILQLLSYLQFSERLLLLGQLTYATELAMTEIHNWLYSIYLKTKNQSIGAKTMRCTDYERRSSAEVYGTHFALILLWRKVHILVQQSRICRRG